MQPHSFNLASGSTAASPTPGVKTFPPKGAWCWSRDRFGMKPRSSNFGNSSTMACATRLHLGLPPPPPPTGSRDRCLNFNPFNISGGIRWRRWGKLGACGLPCFAGFLAFFLNAWIYSEDAVLWHGVAVCHASHYLVIIQPKDDGPTHFTVPLRVENWVDLVRWLHIDLVYPPTDGHPSWH